MHIAVPGAVDHLFHIQRALNQGGVNRVWLSLVFHRELVDCKALALQVASMPTHLADIVCCEPTHVKFCDASGLEAGGVWLDPTGTGHNLVWWHPWPVDATSELVSTTNPHRAITNSDLEFSELVLQETTLLYALLKARKAALRSGSENTSTVSWSTRESLTINLVVADLLRIHALHSRKFI